MRKLAILGVFAVLVTAGAMLPQRSQAQYGGGGVPIITPPTTGDSGGSGRSRSSRHSNPVVQSSTGQVLGESTFNFTVMLAYGSQGNDVVELHKILIADGYLKIDAPTGWFGPLTEAAVKAYQTAHGIEPVGIVGPLTRASLNAQQSAPQETSMIQKAIGAVSDTVQSVLAWSAST